LTTTVTITAADDDALASLAEYHSYHHHGGVTLLLAMSLDTLGVSPEQRAVVERIRIDLHKQMEPARVAERRLLATLVDGLSRSSMDAAKVDAAVGETAVAAASGLDASLEALSELHNVLTPPQRAALIDKIEAHWSVWQKANAVDAGPGYLNDGHLSTLALSLDLTAGQLDKIRGRLGDEMKAVPRLAPQEIESQLRTFGDAFRSETFDSRTLTTASSATAHMVGWGAAHMAHLVEAVSPVLTPDQRAKFAQGLREHASHDPSAQEEP
jgi:Spy/CpxP family protein refolding chaperone